MCGEYKSNQLILMKGTDTVAEFQIFSQQVQQELATYIKQQVNEAAAEIAKKSKKQYFTRDEAAKYLTLKNSCFNDHVRYSIRVAMVGNRLVFDCKDLDEFIERHKT